MKRFWSACKQSRFILMRLHHMLWCGVIGEDYDEFKGIRTSTCLSFESKLTMIFVFFMISQWGIWVWWFPKFSQWGITGFILNGAQLWWFFVRVFSQWGFWVYISVCNPRRYPEHWYPVLAWGECLMVLLMGYILNGWLWRSDDVR